MLLCLHVVVGLALLAYTPPRTTRHTFLQDCYNCMSELLYYLTLLFFFELEPGKKAT